MNLPFTAAWAENDSSLAELLRQTCKEATDLGPTSELDAVRLLSHVQSYPVSPSLVLGVLRGGKVDTTDEALRQQICVFRQLGTLASEAAWPLVALTVISTAGKTPGTQCASAAHTVAGISIESGEFGDCPASARFWVQAWQSSPRHTAVRDLLHNPCMWTLPPHCQVVRQRATWQLQSTLASSSDEVRQAVKGDSPESVLSRIMAIPLLTLRPHLVPGLAELPLSSRDHHAGEPLSRHVASTPHWRIHEAPSRARMRDKIGLAIANGDQPAGACYDTLIRPGCGPDSFLRQLKHIQHPASSPPPMPVSWISALQGIVDLGHKLESYREEQMQLIRDAAKRLQPERAKWSDKLHEDVKHVIGHLHLPLLQWLVEETSYPAQDYVARLMQGRPCLGEIPASGVFKKERNEASTTLQAWAATPRARNERMIGKVTSTGDLELDAKAWEKTKKELQRGYCKGPGEIHELDLDQVCITPRWVKWEQKEDGAWSCRNISDWKASGGNDTVTLLERYSPEDLTMAHASIRVLKDVFGHDTPLRGFRVDWEMAFRQDPVWPGMAHLLYEVFWNPELGRPQWLLPRGGAFGNKAAQLNFVQNPHLVCHVARIMLKILLAHYSDDMWNIEPESSSQQAYALVLELMTLIGWRYDAQKSPPPERRFRLLGVEHLLGFVVPIVQLGPLKVEKLLDLLRRHRQSRQLSSADASSMLGCFNWARSTLWGRVGSAVLSPLRERQRNGRMGVLNTALLAMFAWLEAALVEDNSKPIRCDTAHMKLVVTISDGEGTGNVAVGLWDLSDQLLRPRVTTARVPELLLDKWRRHSQNAIAPIEAVGPLLALATWPHLAHKLWIHFIDNMTAKDSLIRGHSYNGELNELMHATWRAVRARDLRLWVDWVSTNDNPIDKASRGCTADRYHQRWILDPPGDFVAML